MVVEVADLGRALRARRVRVGMSQEEVCRAAGVARSWLSRVEAGRHGGAELQKVLDLVAVLGLSLTLTHEDAPTPQGTRPPAEVAEVTDPPTPRPSPRAADRAPAGPFRPAPRPVGPTSSPWTADAAATTRTRLTEGDPFEHLFG